MESGAKNELKDADGMTPLAWVFNSPLIPIVDVEKCATPHNATLSLSVETQPNTTNKVPRLIKLLLNAGIPTIDNHVVSCAVKTGNFDITVAIVDRINLYRLVSSGMVTVMETLLGDSRLRARYSSAFFSKDNLEQNTMLHAALFRKNLDMARLLLDNGAKIEAVNMAGMTPLAEAVWLGNRNMIDFLLDRGAEPTNVQAYIWYHYTKSKSKLNILVFHEDLHSGLDDNEEGERSGPASATNRKHGVKRVQVVEALRDAGPPTANARRLL